MANGGGITYRPSAYPYKCLYFGQLSVTPLQIRKCGSFGLRCAYAFQYFVMSLGDLNEKVELDKFIRPQCHWYTSTDIEYIDISQIQSHLGLDTVPYTVEKKTSITASEYMSGISQHHQQVLWDIFEEDYLKLDYNIVPKDKYN